jgi:hypothetical protein
MFWSESLLAMCLLWCGMGAAVARADQSSVVEHAPASSVLAIASDDLGQTCSDFQRSRLGETLVGADFNPLVAELRRLQLGGPLYLRPLVGFDWSELQDAHTAGGLFIFPLAEGKQGLVWIFAGSAPAGDASPLAAAARYFSGRKFRSVSETRGTAKLTTWIPPTRKGESPRVLIEANGFYGVANSPAAAEMVLGVSKEKSLAADPLWQQAAQLSTEPARPGDVTLLLRPFELWELSRSSNPQPAEKPASEADVEEPTRDPLASSRQLGFDGVRAVIARLTIPAEAVLDWQITARLITPRPYAKALRLMDIQPGSKPELPAFAAADLSGWTFWRWDFPQAMKGFGNLYDESNEPGPDGVGLFEDMLDGLRDDPEGVQVDLRTEVFAHLGPEIYSVSDYQGAKTKEQPAGERTLYVAQVREQAKVADALQRFYRDDDRVKHEKSGAYDLWTVPEGASLFVEGESDSVVSVRALALGENRILFGTDAAQLQAALTGNSSGTALKQDESWSKLWQLTGQSPENAAMWSLARLDETLAADYAKATSGKPGEEDGPLAALWRVLLYGTADPKTQVPNAAAPTFDRVRPGLPRIGSRFSLAADGWNLTISALRRQD